MRSIEGELPGGNGYVHIVETGDFEYVNPIKQRGESIFLINLNLIDTASKMKRSAIIKVDDSTLEEAVFQMAVERTNKELNRLIEGAKKRKFPVSFMNLFDAEKRVRQRESV